MIQINALHFDANIWPVFVKQTHSYMTVLKIIVHIDANVGNLAHEIGHSHGIPDSLHIYVIPTCVIKYPLL